MGPRIEDSATVHSTANIGLGTQIWHYSQIREHVEIGSDCIIGRNVYIGVGVRIGDKCKIQNNASIYEPASISNGVFIGPGVILTNDHNPRAITPKHALKSASDWESEGVSIGEGASLGAGSICIAPVSIGKWALVGSGAVVTKDVPDFALMMGVPARQVGWVGKSGIQLIESDGKLVCPKTLISYIVTGETITEVQAS
jgi:UDP-2-acetamido-3-amino-2,3-dideoxy-glucuronate N-acetyltransferase